MVEDFLEKLMLEVATAAGSPSRQRGNDTVDIDALAVEPPAPAPVLPEKYQRPRVQSGLRTRDHGGRPAVESASGAFRLRRDP